MADAVTALTHWRTGRREVVRAEHTREVREELPEGARNAIVRLADELADAKARVARLERIILSLHQMAGS
jgi:regulator of protease activity HflC (stomatin/prohibitin superfamily)